MINKQCANSPSSSPPLHRQGTARIVGSQISGPASPSVLPGAGSNLVPAVAPMSTLVPLAGSLLANDTDEDGDALTVQLVAGPSHGTLMLNTTGSFVYTPNAGFAGTDTFTYRLSDGVQHSAPATVTLTVRDVLPVAANDAYSVQRNGLLSVPRRRDGVLANDGDGDGDTLTATVATAPQHGTLNLSASGAFTYTPTAGFVGTDTFTYTASDGTHTATGTVTLTVSNDTPTAQGITLATLPGIGLTVPASWLLDRASDGNGDALTLQVLTQPTHGSVSLAGGNLAFTPTLGFVGTTSFTVRVSDGIANSMPATVTITVGGTAQSVADTVNATQLAAETAAAERALRQAAGTAERQHALGVFSAWVGYESGAIARQSTHTQTLSEPQRVLWQAALDAQEAFVTARVQAARTRETTQVNAAVAYQQGDQAAQSVYQSAVRAAALAYEQALDAARIAELNATATADATLDAALRTAEATRKAALSSIDQTAVQAEATAWNEYHDTLTVLQTTLHTALRTADSVREQALRTARTTAATATTQAEATLASALAGASSEYDGEATQAASALHSSLTTAKTTYEQAVATARANYEAQTPDQGSTSAFDPAEDATYRQAVTQAQADYDGFVVAANTLYRSRIAAARTTRLAVEEAARLAFDVASRSARTTQENAETQAEATFASTMRVAATARDGSLTAAEDAYHTAITQAKATRTAAVQGANLAYDAAMHTARGAYHSAVVSAQATQDAAAVSVHNAYEASVGMADTALRQAMDAARNVSENAQASAVGVYDAAVITARDTQRTATVAAQGAFDASYNSAQLTLDNTGWTAILARRDARKAARQAYEEAGRTANDTHLASRAAAQASDTLAEKAARLTLNNAVWSANTTLMAAEQTHKTAMRLATTQAARDAATATLREAQKAYAVAKETAQVAYAQTRTATQMPLVTAQQEALVTKVNAIANALETLRVAWSQADSVFTTSVSSAVEVFQGTRADAAAVLTGALAAGAAAQQGAMANAERDWNKAVNAADHAETQAISSAISTWKGAEADAERARQLAEAQAVQMAGAAIGVAGQTLKMEESGAFAVWTVAINAVDTAFSVSVSSARVAYIIATSEVEADWAQDEVEAAATRDQSIVASLSTERQVIAAAERSWVLSVSDARSAEATERVAARVEWVNTPPVPGVTPPAEAYGDQRRRDAVAQALVSAATARDTDENTAWSQFGLAQATAWRDWITTSTVSVLDWKIGRVETAEVWAEDALAAWLTAHDAMSTAGQTRAQAETQAWGTWAQTTTEARTEFAVDAAEAGAVYAASRTETEATQQSDAVVAENAFFTATTTANAQRQVAIASAVVTSINAEKMALMTDTDAKSTASGEYADAEAASSQTLDLVWAAADKAFAEASEDANATRVRSAWQAWRVFATEQANAEATRTKGDATAAVALKRQMAVLDVALVSGLARASTDRRIAVTLAEKADSLRRAVASFEVRLAEAQQRLTQTQAKPASGFASVKAAQPLTEWQKLKGALRSFGEDWSIGVENTLNYLTSGASHDLLTSEEFGRHLDAVDGFFAGWSDALTAGLSTRIRAKVYGELATRNHEGFWFNVGSAVGMVHSIILGSANPCSMSTAVRWGYRAVQAMEGVGLVMNTYDHFQKGEYVFAGLSAVGALGNFAGLFRACFVAGTPILAKSGSKAVEEVQSGDLVWSRSEHDPEGPLELKSVVQTFVRVAPVVNLHVRGKVIGTTAEHPFFAQSKGWCRASELEIGDLLQTHGGEWVAVEGVANSGEVATVYNFEVADFHTYFVGGAEWGFAVWAHNQYGPGVEAQLREQLQRRGFSPAVVDAIVARGLAAESVDVGNRWARLWGNDITHRGLANLADDTARLALIDQVATREILRRGMAYNQHTLIDVRGNIVNLWRGLGQHSDIPTHNANVDLWIRRMLETGSYTDIHVNRQLSVLGPGFTGVRGKPDLWGERRMAGGQPSIIDIVEVLHPGQTIQRKLWQNRNTWPALGRLGRAGDLLVVDSGVGGRLRVAYPETVGRVVRPVPIPTVEPPG